MQTNAPTLAPSVPRCEVFSHVSHPLAYRASRRVVILRMSVCTQASIGTKIVALTADQQAPTEL